MSFGPSIIHQGGAGIQALAHLQGVRWKTHGMKIDWTKVNPVEGQNEIVTFDVSAGSGNITIVFGGQTATVAFDATGPTIEAALEALSSIGNGNVRVTRDTATVTIEFVEDLRHTNVGAVTGTGITSPVVSQIGAAAADVTLTDGRVVKIGDKYIPEGTVLSQVTATGLFAPADTTASDGRQTVDATQRGKSFVLNEAIVKSDPGSDHTGKVFDAGTVFEARLKIGGTGQPTRTNFVAMFPGVAFA